MSNRVKVVGYVRDAMIVGGAVLLSVGAGMVYRPAGLITAGVLMLAAGLVGVLR
jgi:hypothetical protein